MGLGDILDQQNSKEEQEESQTEEIDKDELLKKVRDATFLSQYCEDLGIIVEAPEQKEYGSSGDCELPDELPEGYVDCTDSIQFIKTQSKYFPCPHCPKDELTQRRGKGARRGHTWGRCGGCGRILIDREAGNRDDDGKIKEDSGLDNWL